MQILVMQMIYLFEYDDNEEAMIYRIQIFKIIPSENYNLTYYYKNVRIYNPEYVFVRVLYI
jgi:hypothetical protein